MGSAKSRGYAYGDNLAIALLRQTKKRSVQEMLTNEQLALNLQSSPPRGC